MNYDQYIEVHFIKMLCTLKFQNTILDSMMTYIKCFVGLACVKNTDPSIEMYGNCSHMVLLTSNNLQIISSESVKLVFDNLYHISYIAFSFYVVKHRLINKKYQILALDRHCLKCKISFCLKVETQNHALYKAVRSLGYSVFIYLS